MSWIREEEFILEEQDIRKLNNINEMEYLLRRYEKAKEKYTLALQDFDMAESDFIDNAVYKLKAAEEELNIISRKIRENMEVEKI